MLSDKSRQRLPYDIRERAPLGKRNRAERFVLLGLNGREERHRLRKFLLSGSGAPARRSGSGSTLSLHRGSPLH